MVFDAQSGKDLQTKTELINYQWKPINNSWKGYTKPKTSQNEGYQKVSLKNEEDFLWYKVKEDDLG